jgi:hypothetical protein
MAVLKPFSKTQDESKRRAASEVQPVDIPFQHPDYLSAEYSNGVTDRCFFLIDKVNKTVYPYNSSMAESGNVMYMPHFDLEELNNPEHAGSVAIWRLQGILPAGYGGTPAKPAPVAKVAKALPAFKIPESA